jgi:hypothetical protein
MIDVLAFIENAMARGFTPDEIVEAIKRDPATGCLLCSPIPRSTG